ncbi:hypothetical protein O7626_14510 [Micromonospora sp. WMMD1102]|uniref:phosphatase PAP2 family protein n=1 Tax=Micromonospora sp. WMMD1102 TaxID=3016105 RepID=UPI002414EFCE|nr:hypothetical protein [Micromonospora sp. WMMD1102]MDG4787127.1 hypothetical protein [Micromonospora sp. WMMD1102]
MPVIVAVTAAPTLTAGLGWGALAALFSAVIPFGAILVGVRRGKLTDHHVGRREQRRTPMLIGLASVLASLILFAVTGAPRQLTAMVSVMLAVLLMITMVNLRWKLSAHAAVSAGSATVLTIIFGWVLAPAWLAVAAVSWSRVHLHDHTIAQVIAGAAIGTTTAAAVFLALT